MVMGFKEQFVQPILSGKKTHTVREDPHGRWIAGRRMHLATGVRTSNYKQFASGICEMVFPITIDPKTKTVVINFNGEAKLQNVNEFAYNDGFSSVGDFWNWFDKPFVGKLIYFKLNK